MPLLPAVAPERREAITAAFSRARVLVVGDAMLDRFIAGRVTRLSPEAPVPIVAFDHEMHRIGGAANVAHNIVALGGACALVGVTGTDDGAATLTRACRDAGIAPTLVADATRPTTSKVRIVTERKQQVARIDYEADDEIRGAVEATVIAAIRYEAAHVSAIVVSDYVKGAVTRGVMQAVMAAANAYGIPVLVDPKIPHLDYYAGATVITPNHHEAEAATHMRVRTEDEARAAALRFRDRSGCHAVLMTRGDQGIWLLGPDEEGHLPAVGREVADVTGAGDTVIATFALALAAGATVSEAAGLANDAAGIVVGKFGPATVNVGELRGQPSKR